MDLPDILAQQRFSSEVFLWLGVIVAAGVFLGLVATWLRRRLVAEPPPMKLGFTLADLREMHAQGQIDDAEFESAKAKMLARSRQELSEDAKERTAERQKSGGPDKPSPVPADGDEEEVEDLGDLSEPADIPTDPGEDVDKQAPDNLPPDKTGL